jgi:predicted transcriptional regulator
MEQQNLSPTLLRMRELLAARKGSWPDIAVTSGVPYSTLSKIAQGFIDNPRIETVDKLMSVLQAEVRG